MTSSRFNPSSTLVRPQKSWTSPFYDSMNGPGLKTLMKMCCVLFQWFLSLGLTNFTSLSHYKSANSAPLLSPSSLPLQLWSLKRIPERNNKLGVSLFVQLVALHVLRESHWILLIYPTVHPLYSHYIYI